MPFVTHIPQHALTPGAARRSHFLGGIASACFAAELAAAVAAAATPSSPPLPSVHVVDVELGALLLSKAASHGLCQRWLAALQEHDPGRKQALKVLGVPACSPLRGVLLEGDLLLSLGDAVLASFPDVDAAVTAHVAAHGGGGCHVPPMPALAWRGGEEVSLLIPLSAEPAVGSGRVVVWAGAQMQSTHRAVSEMGYLPPTGGVYISRWHHGSPAHRYGLFAAVWLTSVNGVATPDIDALLRAVLGLRDRQPALLSIVTLHGRTKVLTLKTDLAWWPTFELAHGADGCWCRIDHVGASGDA
jgi:S1-C subfamily serine protease